MLKIEGKRKKSIREKIKEKYFVRNESKCRFFTPAI